MTLKHWVATRYVGTVEQLDRAIAPSVGIKAEDIAPVSIDHDVSDLIESLGSSGRSAGVEEFGGFFIGEQDDFYLLAWGFPGTVAYDHKPLYEIVSRLIDEREKAYLIGYFRRHQDGICPQCGLTPIHHDAPVSVETGCRIVVCQNPIV